ncbi:MAG TPA: hypothetical protein VMC06_00460 [Opitutaceae bacterium]|nr:hypothetical protein [Opitutaceae bacterium]
MNLPHRQRWLLVTAGAAVALLALDRLVFTPLTDHWKERSAEIATLQKDIAAGRSTIERAQRTQNLWADMQANALARDTAQAEQDVLSAFEKWRATSSVELSSMKQQWKRGANDSYSVLECRIDATGSLAALARFLYEVEKSPLALRIDSMELIARDEVGSKLSLGLLVTGLRLAPLESKS